MKKIIFSLFISFVTLSMTAQTPVSIPGSMGKLKGVVHMPKVKGNKKIPFVVIMHGFTGNKNEKMLIQISEGLMKRGIGSVRFDFNGHGDSEGEFRNMTIPNEIEDAKLVLATVKQLKGVDPNRIGVIGHSQGGVVASMLAGELGTKAIASVVLLAPAGNIGDGAKVGNLLGHKVDVNNLPETLEVWGHQVGREYMKSAAKIDMYGTAARYLGPVCIIHGSNDKTVPVEFGQRYAKGYKNVEIHIQPNDDHGLSKHRPQTLNYIYNFFTKTLKK